MTNYPVENIPFFDGNARFSKRTLKQLVTDRSACESEFPLTPSQALWGELTTHTIDMNLAAEVLGYLHSSSVENLFFQHQHMFNRMDVQSVMTEICVPNLPVGTPGIRFSLKGLMKLAKLSTSDRAHQLHTWLLDFLVNWVFELDYADEVVPAT